jgi:hypothetical protein
LVKWLLAVDGQDLPRRDVGFANSLSKAVLRSAAEAFTRQYEDVDYFPSYELVTLASRTLAYCPDMLHVADGTVAEIVRQFMLDYCGKTVVRPDGYAEKDYLEANPDVEARVRRGELSCGYEHWVTVGRAEGRLLAP